MAGRHSRRPGGVRRGSSQGAGGVVLDVTVLLTSPEERGIKWIKTEVGIGGGRMAAGVKEELMSFTFWVKTVRKSSALMEEGRGGGVRREGKMENSFLWLEAEEFILVGRRQIWLLTQRR